MTEEDGSLRLWENRNPGYEKLMMTWKVGLVIKSHASNLSNILYGKSDTQIIPRPSGVFTPVILYVTSLL